MKFVALFLLVCAGKSYAYRCPGADLSDEQQQEIDRLKQWFKGESQGLNGEGRRALREQVLQQILGDILTSEEQRAAFQVCFQRIYWKRCSDAHLSKEQKKTIRRLQKQLRRENRGQGLSVEEKKAKREALHQHILNNVLEIPGQREVYGNCWRKLKGRDQ